MLYILQNEVIPNSNICSIECPESYCTAGFNQMRELLTATFSLQMKRTCFVQESTLAEQCTKPMQCHRNATGCNTMNWQCSTLATQCHNQHLGNLTPWQLDTFTTHCVINDLNHAQQIGADVMKHQTQHKPANSHLSRPRCSLCQWRCAAHGLAYAWWNALAATVKVTTRHAATPNNVCQWNMRNWLGVKEAVQCQRVLLCSSLFGRMQQSTHTQCGLNKTQCTGILLLLKAENVTISGGPYGERLCTQTTLTSVCR